MASLSYNDILKRNNVEVFYLRIKNKGSFRKETETGDILVCTGRVKFKVGVKTQTANVVSNTEIEAFLRNKKSTDYMEVEVKNKTTNQWVRPTIFFKDKDFGGVSGKSSGAGSERQESGLINLINETAKNSPDYYFASLGKNKKLKQAIKNSGLSSIGQEPYIDIFIETHGGEKLGVSMKGKSAPSIAGGGLKGIKEVAPDLLKMLYDKIKKYITEDLGIKENAIVDASVVPDLYMEIPSNYVKSILVGNKKMGGPVDYMYIGEMNVIGTSSNTTKEIKVNGTFYSIDEYMKKIPKFYFRIRKRDLDPSGKMEITFMKKNSDGYPLVFKSASSAKNNFRMVIIDVLPNNAKLL